MKLVRLTSSSGRELDQVQEVKFSHLTKKISQTIALLFQKLRQKERLRMKDSKAMNL